MRIGMGLNYAGGFAETVTELADFEKAGLDIVFVPEAYSFDAVSQLGYIAAKTERVNIASGILQLYTRTPTLTAMTAAGLDYVSNGRFILGLGACRGLGADLLLPGEVRRGLGRTAGVRHGPPRSVAASAGRHRPGPAGHRRGRAVLPGAGPAGLRAVHRRDGGQ